MTALSFNRNIQHMRIQTSIKEINHLAPEQLGMLDGPQTLEWIKENSLDDILLLIG